ncbi:T9SS type A sorting domain-containing protein [Tamlana agarivorans]|uniref:T9SS type A sorting domain-containing protein n=1 Tax=Pseudotamlana agarivorans TaxID=481183 RepID=A0ACC5UAF0_9FLAO|nr:T9SS type A sorting domain-containing protein [Tamlana agarivorans]MBU2951313.1 T9SS type A sorting domain-containing protein [Tamlana agarivorans]
MNRTALFLFLSFLVTPFTHAQVVLKAEGQGNTYDLITNVLAPGYSPIETPDCAHTAFGDHIDEVFDAELQAYVFQFHLHVAEDNDRCKNFDRQRNEIKTYDKSPDNLVGTENEIVQYKWRFKISADFQSSSSFTHIHQIKSVGGALESMPMYTLTTRKGAPDQLELRYAETNSQSTLKKTDLTPLKGTWVEVTETITYSTVGTYAITIKKVSDNSELFSYSNNNMINWRPGATIVRPKWGIYRSLNAPQDIKDEIVSFEYFSIEELQSLSTDKSEKKNARIKVHPNPSQGNVFFTEELSNSFDSFSVYNSLGKQVVLKSRQKTLDTSTFNSGAYYIIFYKNHEKVADHKLLIN